MEILPWLELNHKNSLFNVYFLRLPKLVAMLFYILFYSWFEFLWGLKKLVTYTKQSLRQNKLWKLRLTTCKFRSNMFFRSKHSLGTPTVSTIGMAAPGTWSTAFNESTKAWIEGGRGGTRCSDDSDGKATESSFTGELLLLHCKWYIWCYKL